MKHFAVVGPVFRDDLLGWFQPWDQRRFVIFGVEGHRLKVYREVLSVTNGGIDVALGPIRPGAAPRAVSQKLGRFVHTDRRVVILRPRGSPLAALLVLKGDPAVGVEERLVVRVTVWRRRSTCTRLRAFGFNLEWVTTKAKGVIPRALHGEWN